MSLYVAVLVTITLGLMDPMNPFYGATDRIIPAIGHRGWLSDGFVVLGEKSGAPKMANTVLAILTVMGPFLGKNMLISLTSISALAFIFLCTMISFTCLKMRCMEPDPPGPYKVPGGKADICMVRLAGTIIVGFMVVPLNPAVLKPVEWAIVAAWLVTGLGLSVVIRARGDNKAAAAAR